MKTWGLPWQSHRWSWAPWAFPHQTSWWPRLRRLPLVLGINTLGGLHRQKFSSSRFGCQYLGVLAAFTWGGFLGLQTNLGNDTWPFRFFLTRQETVGKVRLGPGDFWHPTKIAFGSFDCWVVQLWASTNRSDFWKNNSNKNQSLTQNSRHWGICYVISDFFKVAWEMCVPLA